MSNKVVDLNQSVKELSTKEDFVPPCDLFARTFKFGLPQRHAKWSILGVFMSMLLISLVVGNVIVKYSQVGRDINITEELI